MFTITDGDFYVDAYIGNDSNSGSLASPFKTLQRGRDAAAVGERIICRGYFEEYTVGSREILIGDGYFEINGNNVTSGTTGVNSYSVQNAIIKDWVVVSSGNGSIFDDCIIVDCNTTGGGTSNTYRNCVFRNVRVGYNGSLPISVYSLFNGCTFVNCQDIRIRFSTVKNCIFEENNIDITIQDAVANDFNAYENALTINGDTVAQWRLDNPLFDISSIDGVDLELNDVADGDVTISVTSPCKGAGEGGIDIGAFLKCASFDGLSPEFDGTTGNGLKDANVSIDGNGHITLTSGATGTLTSDVIDLVSKGLDSPAKSVIFWADEDNNVGSIIDESLNRDYTFEMRWGANVPAVLAASFTKFLRRKDLTIDGSGLGNGEAGFNPSTETSLSADFVQIRITIRNV